MTDKRQELRALLEETIDEQVDKRVAKIQNENKELRATVNKLQDKILTLVDERDSASNEAKDAKVLLEVVEIFKQRLDNIQEKAVRPEFVYNLLELFFEPDFEESTYDCPIWLGAVVNFYSHKDIVVRLLKVLGIYVPNNIEQFRLPQDWRTDELDIVFDTMGKHIVCNNELFGNNLRFWEPFALDSVYDVCHNCTYSEIPWQFLLRNPNLLDVKYLSKIGTMAFDVPYVSGWRTLFNIEHYQDLTEEHIKIIIDNINPFHVIKSESRYTTVYNFLLSHLEHVTTKSLLDSIYTAYSDSYDFKYKNCLIKMPYEYSVKWMKEYKDLEWLKRNKSSFNNEQLKELILTAMEE